MSPRKAAAVVASVACVLTSACAAATGQVDGNASASGGLERFYTQHPEWKACNDEGLDTAGAQCADITVPLNYAEPQGRTITVVISRLRAADPAKRRGIMLSNPGGPGGPGLDSMLNTREAMTTDVRDRYDLIGMDPRGVGRSTPVNCGWPVGFGMESAGENPASFGKSVAEQADMAARCLAAERDKLPYITTRNTARDMDVIRGALGEEKISYFGTSYGTYLGAVFTQMFPDRSDRMVLDSAVDPQRYGMGMKQDMGAANEAALDAWADWTAARNDEYRLGTTRSEVRSVVTGLIRQSASTPIRIGSYEIDDRWLPTLLFTALDDPRHYDVPADYVRRLADAAAGKPVQPSEKLETDLASLLTARPRDNSPMIAIMCGDVSFPRDPQWYWHNVEASRATQPVFGPFVNNIISCAFWPQPVEPPTAVHNQVPALIVQATGDTRTAYEEGVGLHRAMTASRLVTLQDVRIHSVYDRFPNRCVKNAVNTYFRDGTLPTTDMSCTAD
ncbi:alpha/beta hydrolase [Nocardia terpenica]|uniref:Transporter n=1 Tax=Nocardia terpenica TaxID=455432 RepID=A0A291RP80_9NOCA|nr:alpha/beta hydrolase [Nocardia terpenica]ATL69363.1 transporter [Nocardia terpenica]